MKARLLQSIPEERRWLISGDGSQQPAVGDIGDTDQCFTGPYSRQMVCVYFLAANGASEWGVEAYEVELEPVDPPPRPINLQESKDC
jgi:hypothetical protein